MGKIRSILVITLLLFSACHKHKTSKPPASPDTVTGCTAADPDAYLAGYHIDSLCTSDLCVKYQAIWKQLLMEENKLDDSFFDAHVILLQSGLDRWDQGLSYRICYEVRFDWAIAYQCDQFIIRIDTASNLYPDHGLPRGVYLSGDQVRRAVTTRSFGSSLHALSGDQKLGFPTRERAMAYLKARAGVNALCFSGVTLNGDLILQAVTQYIHQDNSCLSAQLDLSTGEATVQHTVCYYN